MIPATSEDISTVVSIMPIRLEEDKPLVPSHYYIPPCLDTDNDVECLMIRRGSFRVYVDENRPALIIPEPSDVIAGAICRDFKVSITHFEPAIAEPGLFWVRGGYEKSEILTDKTVRNDLNHARELQKEWFKRLVKAADDDWATYKMRKTISDLQRLACKCLALERDWDIDLEVARSVRMIPCKFCRAEIHPESIICMHCRGVLDMVKFKRDFVSADDATPKK
jgi:hypothetical protein